jgi:hypothetical protein
MRRSRRPRYRPQAGRYSGPSTSCASNRSRVSRISRLASSFVSCWFRYAVTSDHAAVARESTQQFSFCQVGRARHSVRAGPGAPVSERRARSDAPYPATHPHNENCWRARAPSILQVLVCSVCISDVHLPVGVCVRGLASARCWDGVCDRFGRAFGRLESAPNAGLAGQRRPVPISRKPHIRAAFLLE